MNVRHTQKDLIVKGRDNNITLGNVYSTLEPIDDDERDNEVYVIIDDRGKRVTKYKWKFSKVYTLDEELFTL